MSVLNPQQNYTLVTIMIIIVTNHSVLLERAIEGASSPVDDVRCLRYTASATITAKRAAAISCLAQLTWQRRLESSQPMTAESTKGRSCC